jgi:hypothetical protein
MDEYGIYLVGIKDSNEGAVGCAFLPLGPYKVTEETALTRGRLWIAEAYEESTGVLTVEAADVDAAWATANRYLSKEYRALREAADVKKEWAA